MTAVRLTEHIVLIPRTDWGADHPSRVMSTQRVATEGYIHHSTDPLAEHVDTLAEQKMAVRAIQRFHMRSRGYSDIAYHYIVMQPWGARHYARIFQGRMRTEDPAAQQDHNHGTLAVCVFGNFDHDDKVFANTRYALEVLIRQLFIPFGVTGLGGHRDAPGQSTECPGDTLEAAVTTIAHATNLRRITR